MAEEAAQESNIREQASRSPTGPYILIVEDDAFLVHAYEVMLSTQGFVVRIAPDGEQALAAINSTRPPALVLLDLMLPRVSGFEVLEAVRKDPHVSDIPIIVLSNLGQPADIERAKALGARDYFVKSDTPLENVVETVRKYFPTPGTPALP